MILLSKSWTWALTLALIVQAQDYRAPERLNFQYQRDITIQPGTSSQACLSLDKSLFTHASPLLTDLRLRADSDLHDDTPYALTVSEAATLADEPANVVRLGRSGEHIVFDLQMPSRPYSSIALHLNAENFVAIASVYGERPGEPQVDLGRSTIFDLSAKHLGRSTMLILPESTFPRLHITLTFTPVPGHTDLLKPDTLLGASIPPSREAQTLFTVVDETSTVEQQGNESVIRFQLPVWVPIERVEFLLSPTASANFRRNVFITARSLGSTQESSERIEGEIGRVHTSEAGHEIDQTRLAIPAVLGANMQSPAAAEIRVENGDDRPLAIASVRLEMRQRKLCFPVPSWPVRLVYGVPQSRAPIDDFAKVFAPSATYRIAVLGPEQKNPNYVDPGDTRTLSERHPELLWITLLGIIGILGFLAFRAARRHDL